LAHIESETLGHHMTSQCSSSSPLRWIVVHHA
jgi:hypothetical protein